jgi:hypothetical protein
MSKRTVVLLTILFSVILLVNFNFADDLNGYMIPEYYMVGGHHTGGEDEGGIEGQHGFWIRRIYFGYNTGLGNGWSGRLRLEMNSPAFSEGTMAPYVKDAYLKKALGGGASLIVGIMEPPSFDRIEKFWGLRFIEKTPPDFFKLASSRDFGLALDGKAKGGLVYTLMYGNYGSNKGEANAGKGFYARLGWESKTAYVEANGHFADDGSKDKTYFALFGGLKGGWGRLGLSYFLHSQKPGQGENKNSGIISGFAVIKVAKKAEIFARYDHFTDVSFSNIGDYVPIPAKDYKSRFLMAGLNFKIHDMITLSPNVKYVFYGGDNAPHGDFYLNLTAFFEFKTNLFKSADRII